MPREPKSGIFYTLDAEARANPEQVRLLYVGQCTQLPDDLAQFPAIEFLDLEGSKQLDWDSAGTILARMPRLSVLRLHNCALSARRFPIDVVRSMKLSKLDLGYPKVGYPASNVFTAAEARTLAEALEVSEIVFPRPADELEDLTEFGSGLPEKATRHIKDRALLLLYWHLHHDSYRALTYAERILASATDRLAVLEAMADCLDRFCAELTELRGYKWTDDAILAEYGHQYAHLPPDQMFEWQRRVAAEIELARAAGAKSRIFPAYAVARRRWDDAIKEAAAEFVNEMEEDESLEAQLGHAMYEHLRSDPQAVAEDLMKVKQLQIASPRFSTAAAAIANNAIVALGKQGKLAPAQQVVRAWIEGCGALEVPGWLREELAGNALACGATKDRALRELVLARLVPDEVFDERLAFNLACVQAAAGDKQTALRWVALALELGRDPQTFLRDADLAELGSDPEFQTLVQQGPAAR